MKTQTKGFLSLAAVVSLVLASCYGFPVQKLPEEGTWATYFIHHVVENANGQTNEYRGTLTVRALGGETVDGKPCRWIEFDQTIKPEGSDRKLPLVVKLLVSEKKGPDGEAVPGKIVRGWAKGGDDPAKRLSELDEADQRGITWLLSAAKKRDRKEQAKTVRWQKGTLKCPFAFTAATTIEADSGTTIETSRSVWPHEKAPFGVAAAETKIVRKRNKEVRTTITTTYTLQDTGQGGAEAKSALPDVQ